MQTLPTHFILLFSLDKNLINHQEEFELGILVRRPPNKNLIGEYFSVFSLLKKGCHGNGAIARFVQLFGSGITQFLNPEILSFHLMYDAAWSTAGLGYS